MCHQLPGGERGAEILVWEQQVTQGPETGGGAMSGGSLVCTKQIPPSSPCCLRLGYLGSLCFAKVIFMTAWARDGQCLARSLPPPFSPHLCTDTTFLAPWDSDLWFPWRQPSGKPGDSELTFEIKPIPQASGGILLWLLSRDFCLRPPILLLWPPQALETQPSPCADSQNVLGIDGFQHRLNWTDSLVSVCLLHPPSWFQRLRWDHCSIFSLLLMRRCSLITRRWSSELTSFILVDLAKNSWIFLCFSWTTWFFISRSAKATELAVRAN